MGQSLKNWIAISDDNMSRLHAPNWLGQDVSPLVSRLEMDQYLSLFPKVKITHDGESLDGYVLFYREQKYLVYVIDFIHSWTYWFDGNEVIF